MTIIPWIQLSSRMIENTASPLDWKMQLNTQDRLDLTTTQRWLWMIVYDTELNKWKQLINHHSNTATVESDWSDFWVQTSSSLSINKDIFNITDWSVKQYSLSKEPVLWSIILSINWIENFEWLQFTISWSVVVIENDCILTSWDIIVVKYFY